jgi:hypothetical protein
LLRSKTESLKLYARWLGPYLKQARQLEQNAKGSARLLSRCLWIFNMARKKAKCSCCPKEIIQLARELRIKLHEIDQKAEPVLQNQPRFTAADGKPFILETNAVVVKF